MGCVRVSAVVEHVVVIATGLLKCIGQNRHAVECPIFVNAACESEYVRREPGCNGDGAERVAEDLAEHVALPRLFHLLRALIRPLHRGVSRTLTSAFLVALSPAL